VLGSLPSERLCRFNAPMQPQCGHGDCLREKAVSSTPARHGQNEKANGTSLLLPKSEMVGRVFFLTALQDGGTRLKKV
jgi:hypothetical protein